MLWQSGWLRLTVGLGSACVVLHRPLSPFDQQGEVMPQVPPMATSLVHSAFVANSNAIRGTASSPLSCLTSSLSCHRTALATWSFPTEGTTLSLCLPVPLHVLFLDCSFCSECPLSSLFACFYSSLRDLHPDVISSRNRPRNPRMVWVPIVPVHPPHGPDPSVLSWSLIRSEASRGQGWCVVPPPGTMRGPQ